MNDALDTGLKRTAELSAIFMIGNGLVGLMQPERRVELWTSDVRAIDAFVKADRGRTLGKRRMIALLQVAAGLLLASQMRAKR